MAIDISSYYSMFNSLSGVGTQSSFPSTSTTNFADYFLNATSSTEKNKNAKNSLFSDLSSFGTSSALQNLLGASSTNNDIVSSYLATSATSNNSNDSDDSASTDTFSSFIQSNFQSQQMKMLTTAKENLQVQATKYGESMAGNDSEAVKFRMQQMSQNIGMLDQYLTQKQGEMTTKTDLMEQLKASSAYTQFLNMKSNVTL